MSLKTNPGLIVLRYQSSHFIGFDHFNITRVKNIVQLRYHTNTSKSNLISLKLSIIAILISDNLEYVYLTWKICH